MEVSTREESGHFVVTVTGEVDLYSSPRMREALLGAFGESSRRVVVDLSEVSYMDSSGIATLVEALQAARKAQGTLILAGLSERVREVFELARLESVFDIAPDLASALARRDGRVARR